MRELILDDSFPRALARELVARGRSARTVHDLGLAGATDEEVAAAVAAAGAVLVTTAALPGVGAAVIGARAAPARRDTVHRRAHAIAAQRPGSTRHY